MAYSMYNKRGYFYDVRNLPYGYYGMHHHMDMVEYQRGRPTKLPIRLLNRQFKRTVIPLTEEPSRSCLIVSIQPAKGKQPAFLVLAGATPNPDEDTEEVRSAETVSIPESLAPALVQQLRKLAKWKPSVSGLLPSAGQGLVFEDTVIKAQIVSLTSAEPAEPARYAVKILTETRARDPTERRELTSVLIPTEPAVLTKLKSTLADLLVMESPLYHTESLQGSDGSKFYLDLIREEASHYLKISHVTRDFRSIVIVPAGDVEALRDLLDISLNAMKIQQPQLGPEDSAKAAAGANGVNGKRKRGRNNPRRRPDARGQQRRRKGKENGSSDSGSPAARDANAAVAASAAAAAPVAAADGDSADSGKQRQAVVTESSEDNSTVESRPVENGDGSVSK